jgi:UDP-glucuronate 4-epimerase
MKVIVTGCSGFIGMHVSRMLLDRGDTVVGVDNMNHYYEPALKEARLAQLMKYSRFDFHQIDISNKNSLFKIFSDVNPDFVVHLAAQAGVRYSVEHPEVYVQSNLVGFGNILEASRLHQIKHLVYASSSSVYGGNDKVPFEELDQVDSPVSLYAATKKANELMAHSYSHIFGLPTTGLRFFTVYGPWGRPDMSPYLFTRAILSGSPIKVFNHGNMMRDFTYIDDVVEGVIRCMDKIPGGHQSSSDSKVLQANQAKLTPYRIFNIGNNEPVKLLDYINALEQAWQKTTTKEFLPMQSGDVQKTMASTDRLESWVEFKPKTSLFEGIEKFVDWYRDYYHVN